MNDGQWMGEFPAAITVCDPEGLILEMNERACKAFAKDGGAELIGKNLLDCHPPDAQKKVAELLKTRQLNVYTIEKDGIKKLIYQSPWYENGEYRGIVEFSLPIPSEIPHFIRSSSS
jgi:PAS domain S-box-containing protein